jgi:hypothetical protein
MLPRQMPVNWLMSVNIMSNECAKFDQEIWGKKIIIDTTNCIISQNVAAFFNQLRGHPQTTRVHKTKITIGILIFGQNQISVCYTMQIKF